ncbi:MAG TPA: efflux RND transporter periplasmic adaptor subunit, partial [Acidimicrobiales bacterium]
SSLQVVAGFSETDAAKIAVGQPATVTFNALPNQNLQGKVSQVSVNSQVVSNVVTYNVTVSITNAPSSLKPGMTANVAVTTSEQNNVVAIPTSAVTAAGNSTTLEVLQPNGKTVGRLVTIGLRGDTEDEITSGLNPGDKVVVSRAGASSSTTGSSFRFGGGGLGGLGGLGGGGAVRVGGG